MTYSEFKERQEADALLLQKRAPPDLLSLRPLVGKRVFIRNLEGQFQKALKKYDSPLQIANETYIIAGNRRFELKDTWNELVDVTESEWRAD